MITIVQSLVFPGLVYALVAALFMAWLERKVLARVQGRIGPPFMQPFFDIVKLLGKRSIRRPAPQGFIMGVLPVASVIVTLAAATLLPVFRDGVQFKGDLVLFISLLEAGPLFSVLGGYASRSLWGGLGATREAVMTVCYNLPFLTAIVALAWGGPLQLTSAADAHWPVRVAAVVAVLMCLPAKLHLNPFSVAEAEQEIYAGTATEYDGWKLAFWDLAHGLEWVVLAGLIAVVVLPSPLAIGGWLVPAVMAVSVVVVLVLSSVAGATARLKLAQTARWFWLWGLLVAVVAFVLAVVGV
ncbi:MAG: NADH-quinone oxidoreductase subunit H [Propionibacteriaceae bacterium]|nr:NADH-quinone oxidoreductase subunit H [Propionibacteriaceae bacterium]